MRPHRHLAAALTECLRQAAAEIDLERTAIELAQLQEDGSLREAVLDLYVLFPGSTTPYYIDVTIRCPHAGRYLASSSTPGHAAAPGASQKAARYGPQVITIAIETYGRFAADSVGNLEFLAAAAGDQLRDRWAAPRLLPDWKESISRATIFATADIDLLCLGGATSSEMCHLDVGPADVAPAFARQPYVQCTRDMQ